MDELSSSDYLQGLFGGAGYSIQKNADGDYVLEVDRINARKSLSVIELIVNQITAHGGMHIYSAASLTVSVGSRWEGVFLTRRTVLFTTNSRCWETLARGQRFPTHHLHYWVEVTEVGVDYIVLDGATPLVGRRDCTAWQHFQCVKTIGIDYRPNERRNGNAIRIH